MVLTYFYIARSHIRSLFSSRHVLLLFLTFKLYMLFYYLAPYSFRLYSVQMFIDFSLRRLGSSTPLATTYLLVLFATRPFSCLQLAFRRLPSTAPFLQKVSELVVNAPKFAWLRHPSFPCTARATVVYPSPDLCQHVFALFEIDCVVILWLLFNQVIKSTVQMIQFKHKLSNYHWLVAKW